MKSKDIISECDIPEEVCDCCYLHNMADKKLKDEILCPRCDKPLIKGHIYEEDYVVVGEANYYYKDHRIGKYQIYHCDNCKKSREGLYVLMPIPIIWNANHDIYYTGGRDYLPEDTNNIRNKIKEKIMPLIEQYTRRILNGESLNSDNLLWWIQGDIQRVIAEYLYDKGYKK